MPLTKENQHLAYDLVHPAIIHGVLTPTQLNHAKIEALNTLVTEIIRQVPALERHQDRLLASNFDQPCVESVTDFCYRLQSLTLDNTDKHSVVTAINRIIGRTLTTPVIVEHLDHAKELKTLLFPAITYPFPTANDLNKVKLEHLNKFLMAVLDRQLDSATINNFVRNAADPIQLFARAYLPMFKENAESDVGKHLEETLPDNIAPDVAKLIRGYVPVNREFLLSSMAR